MIVPALILGFILSTLYGAIFHFWRGGGPGRLLFYLCLSWAGFAIGQFAASKLGWAYGKLGSIHIITATLGSILFLGVGYWLSLVQVERR